MARNYEFSDLLHVFFALRIDALAIATYTDFARACHVSRRTVVNWFSGATRPSSAQQIEAIALALGLIPEHADLLFFAVNPAWVRYGTPLAALQELQIVRSREFTVPSTWNDQVVAPAIPEMERTWRPVWEDTFQSNYQRWGLGSKSDGVGTVERRMHAGQLQLTLTNHFHAAVFLGADSDCFAPPQFYLSVSACILQSDTRDGGYVVIFNELSDNRHAVFRIREGDMQASVVQTFEGKEAFEIYLNRVSAPSIRPGTWNKLGILALHTSHWFYINDRLVGKCIVPRYSTARLDLGVVSEQQSTVTVAFRNMTVRVPPATAAGP